MNRTPSEKWIVPAAACVYGLTLLAMAGAGVAPRIPLAFLPVLLLMHVPLAYPLLRGSHLIEPQLAMRPTALRAAALAAGLAVVFALPPLWSLLRFALWLFLPLALFEIARGQIGSLSQWGRSLLVLFLGYASVWNLNYLAAAASGELLDAHFVAMDRAVYTALFGAPETGPMFPVFRNGYAIDVLQHSYKLLFTEIFVVLGVLLMRGEDVARFLLTTFAIYFVGIVVFAVLPVAGPHLSFYPELFHPDLLERDPFGSWMSTWESEFRAARALGSSNGFGYFVGLPSLHVAMALWLQLSLRSSPFHFWLCLPVNLVMIASTCLLGYHWIADAVAAVPVVWAVLAARSWYERREGREAREAPHSA